MKKIWSVEAQFVFNAKNTTAQVVVKGEENEVADHIAEAAKLRGLEVSELSPPIPIKKAPLNISHVLAKEMGEEITAIGTLSYTSVSDFEIDDDLSIKTIDGVQPLDLQFGELEPICVPESLKKIVFDQGEEEIPMGTFALIEGARYPNLSERLESSGLEYRCLFTGKAQDSLGDVGPWIVRLENNHPFTQALFTRDPKDNLGRALWDSDTFTLIRSPVSLQGLWRHFRKFTQVTDEATNKRLFFRFYAPETLCTFVTNMEKKDLQDLLKGCVLFSGKDTNDIFVLIHRENYNF